MQYRVKNIIETLKRLPPPDHVGQVVDAPILIETWEAEEYMRKKRTVLLEYKTIRVRAEIYSHGSNRHLEWVYDV